MDDKARYIPRPQAPLIDRLQDWRERHDDYDMPTEEVLWQVCLEAATQEGSMLG